MRFKEQMDTTYSEKIANLCDIPDADNEYWGIYEIHNNGDSACVGILQHPCSANLYKDILLHQYERCKLVEIPTIVLKKVKDSQFFRYCMCRGF